MVPAHRAHAFRALGEEVLVTYGIHCNGKRIVEYRDVAGWDASPPVTLVVAVAEGNVRRTLAENWQ